MVESRSAKETALILTPYRFARWIYCHCPIGKTRILLTLPRFLRTFRRVTVPILNGETLVVDLRVASSYSLLSSSPPFLDPAEHRAVLLVVKPGDVVFDIGASIGLYSVVFSQTVGPSGSVFAFEPNPAVLPALEETILRLPNATLFPGGLADESNRLALLIPGDPSMASLADWTRGEHGKVTSCFCDFWRLDDLIEKGTVPRPDFMKCDVEGAELLVFRGARNLLNSPGAPVLFFEINVNASRGFNLSLMDVINFLRDLDHPSYRFFHIPEVGLPERIEILHKPHSMILAVPQAKLSRFPALSEAVASQA